MVKLFESRIFNILLPVGFLLLIVSLSLYGCLLGITDIPTLIANSVLMLLATLIAISLPLHAARKGEEERRAEEQKMVYMEVSNYVLNEILDDVVKIEGILGTTKKFEEEFKTQGVPEKAQKMASVGMWLATTEELEVSLEDKWHQCMVTSGLVAKVPNDEVRIGIRLTYQKMDNILNRMRMMKKFCEKILNPSTNVPPQFKDYQLNVKFPEGVKAIEKDVEIFMKQANKTTTMMNKQLKAYKRKIGIVEYKEEE